MLTAWVLWRSPEMVDWAWGAKARDYHSGSPVTMSSVFWYFRYNEMLGNQHRSERNMRREDFAGPQMQAAIDAIADALENNRIRSIGNSPHDTGSRPVTAADWRKADIASLTLASSDRLADAIYAAGTDKVILLAVRVMREDVMSEPWPDFGPARSRHAVEASKPSDQIDTVPEVDRQALFNAETATLLGHWPQPKLHQHLKDKFPHLRPTFEEAVAASKFLPVPLTRGSHGPQPTRRKNLKSVKSNIYS